MTKIKGWSKNDAEEMVRLRQYRARETRSEFTTRAMFDMAWSEWAVVTEHPTEPSVIERKKRPGLKKSLTWRMIEKEPA